MIDPFTALAAIQTAVKLVKTAAQTVKDVESLGPVLGKFFSAKSDAIKVVQQSKTGGFKGSAMGKAIELELAIESARAFEEEIKMLFFQSNKMDVWAKILARAASIDKEAAHEARRQREAAARHKKEMDEVITLVLMFVVLALVCGGVGWIIYRAVQECGGKC
jgi:predicted Rdx family selenoprotein